MRIVNVGKGVLGAFKDKGRDLGLKNSGTGKSDPEKDEGQREIVGDNMDYKKAIEKLLTADEKYIEEVIEEFAKLKECADLIRVLNEQADTITSFLGYEQDEEEKKRLQLLSEKHRTLASRLEAKVAELAAAATKGSGPEPSDPKPSEAIINGFTTLLSKHYESLYDEIMAKYDDFSFKYDEIITSENFKKIEQAIADEKEIPEDDKKRIRQEVEIKTIKEKIGNTYGPDAIKFMTGNPDSPDIATSAFASLCILVNKMGKYTKLDEPGFEDDYKAFVSNVNRIISENNGENLKIEYSEEEGTIKIDFAKGKKVISKSVLSEEIINAMKAAKAKPDPSKTDPDPAKKDPAGTGTPGGAGAGAGGSGTPDPDPSKKDPAGTGTPGSTGAGAGGSGTPDPDPSKKDPAGTGTPGSTGAGAGGSGTPDPDPAKKDPAGTGTPGSTGAGAGGSGTPDPDPAKKDPAGTGTPGGAGAGAAAPVDKQQALMEYEAAVHLYNERVEELTKINILLATVHMDDSFENISKAIKLENDANQLEEELRTQRLELSKQRFAFTMKYHEYIDVKANPLNEPEFRMTLKEATEAENKLAVEIEIKISDLTQQREEAKNKGDQPTVDALTAQIKQMVEFLESRNSYVGRLVLNETKKNPDFKLVEYLSERREARKETRERLRKAINGEKVDAPKVDDPTKTDPDPTKKDPAGTGTPGGAADPDPSKTDPDPSLAPRVTRFTLNLAPLALPKVNKRTATIVQEVNPLTKRIVVNQIKILFSKGLKDALKGLSAKLSIISKENDEKRVTINVDPESTEFLISTPDGADIANYNMVIDTSDGKQIELTGFESAIERGRSR